MPINRHRMAAEEKGGATPVDERGLKRRLQLFVCGRWGICSCLVGFCRGLFFPNGRFMERLIRVV